MARTQIQRARTLSVGFIGSRRCASRLQVDMLQLLSKRSTIWQELRLRLIPALLPPMTACCGRLPMLRRAWVMWDGQESQTAVESVDFFQEGPSLADIAVSSQFRFIPTLLPIHHQLTRYDFDGTWATHSVMLRSLPNLQEVRISRGFEPGVPWPAPGKPIRLLHLRRMFVSHIQCLDYLSAPALESIAFHSRGVEIQTHFGSFVTRCSCILRRLCIVGLPNTRHVEEILQQHLSITVTDMKSRIGDIEHQVITTYLARFTISDSTRILPHLPTRFLMPKHQCYFLSTLSEYARVTVECIRLCSAGLPAKAVVYPDPGSLAKMETFRLAGMQISFLSGDLAKARGFQWVFHSWDVYWRK
ncbi:hypothetical protein C8R45DRAFT_363612 [Mycena sanguinolenta]|nr:hypothetical protein C8R45DRAFT_363612 [Mycena sanguinolenta]